MNEQSIEHIVAEIQSLKTQMAELRQMIKSESDDTTFHIREIHKLINRAVEKIGDLRDLVWPIVEKHSPALIEDLRAIAALNGGDVAPAVDKLRKE
jgi:ribosomal protein L29